MDYSISANLAFFRSFRGDKLHFNKYAIGFICRCSVNGSESPVRVGFVNFRVRGDHARSIAQRRIKYGLCATRINVCRANYRTNGWDLNCSQRSFCRSIAIDRGDYRRRVSDAFLPRGGKDSPTFRFLRLL